MYMKKNEIAIIEYLKNANKKVSIDFLASFLDVNRRTILNCVKRINSTNNVITKDGNYLSFSSSSDFLDTDSRINYLIKELSINNMIDVYEFASSQFVSDHTIEADIEKIKDIFLEYHLKISRKKDLYIVIGNESDRRKFISHQIFLESKGFLNNYKRELDNLFNSKNIQKEILYLLSIYDYCISPYNLKDLIIHIQIVIERLKNKNYIQENNYIDLIDDQILTCSNKLSNYIESEYQVTIPDKDKKYIALLLYSKIDHELNENDDDFFSKITKSKYWKISNEIITKIKESYAIELEDKEFQVRLFTHLYSAIIRSISGHPAKSLYTTTFKRDYPFIFDLGVFISSILSCHSIFLNDDEISFIAFYIGAYIDKAGDQNKTTPILKIALLIENYNSTIFYFRKKILNHVGSNVEKLDVINSIDELNNQYDMIISTKKFNQDTNAPYVLVSPILNDDDISKIKHEIYQLVNKTNNLYTICPEKYFTKELYLDSYIDYINYLSNELMKDGIVGVHFADNVIHREELSSTSFLPLIVIPHSIKMEASSTRISLVINKKPFDWNGKKINIIILIACSINDVKIYNQFTEAISSKFYLQNNVAKHLLEIDSAKEFIDYIFNN